MAKTKKEDPVKNTAEEETTAKQEETAAETEEQPTETEKLQKELAAAKEAHIRTLAEYDNYRKRTAREKEAAYGDSKADCVKELLGVLDNFERAIGAGETDLESYKKGVEMIYSSFCETLKKLGVEAFGEKGDSFDPNIHNGVMHTEDAELGENVIAQVFSKGYRIGDRILRPAMVQVAN